jgi:hypothetical protein
LYLIVQVVVNEQVYLVGWPTLAGGGPRNIPLLTPRAMGLSSLTVRDDRFHTAIQLEDHLIGLLNTTRIFA